jgi:transcriptional regulator with XRE-family HTH domain
MLAQNTQNQYVHVVTRTNTVNRKLIAAWVDANDPHGCEKLAVAAGVSPSMVRALIKRGHVPLPRRRRALALAMGVAESELFPLIQTESDEKQTA